MPNKITYPKLSRPTLTIGLLFVTLLAVLLPTRALADDAFFALAFNGSNEYVNLGDTGNVFGNGGWAGTKTISLWVKPTGAAAPATVPTSGELIVGNDRPRLFGISRAQFNGQDRIWLWNADSSGVDLIGIEYTLDEWVHIAFVHENGSLSAYKNGVLVGAVASGDTFVPSRNGTIYFGGSGRSNPALYFAGEIDEVRFWDAALDGPTLQAWLYSDLTSSHPHWNALTAYYKMSDGAGTNLTDDTGNGNLGTLLGGMSDPNWVSSGAMTPPGAPTNTPEPPTPTPTNTDVPTNTPEPPTPTPTNTEAPTNTPEPPTATPTNTEAPTNTPEPPTATPTNTDVPTNTPEPPTATPTDIPGPTNTPEPPTATPTNTEPPTSTPVPPTPTPTNTDLPTNTPEPPTNTPEPPTPTPTATSNPGTNFALDFDGSNDFVELARTGDMMSSSWVDTKSVSLWVQPENAAPVCQVQTPAWCDAIFGDRPRWWGISQGVINGQDRIWVWNFDNSPGSAYDIIGIEYTAGEWAHIALVHNGGVLTAYKNGVVVGSVASGTTIQPPGNPILHIGGIINNTSRNWTFAGQLDEVRIWNIARTQSEILLNMSQPLSGTETGLAAYYQMSDGAGTILTDDSTNNWQGTLFDGARGVPPDGNPPLWVLSSAFDGPNSFLTQLLIDFLRD